MPAAGQSLEANQGAKGRQATRLAVAPDSIAAMKLATNASFSPVRHWGAAVLACAAALAPAHADGDCTALQRLRTDDATVLAATPTPAGSLVDGQTLPAATCRVQGMARPSADSEIRFEVWLPAAPGAWTGRMKLNGTGGFAGHIPYGRLVQDVGDGFVSAGSNMGHDGGENAAWTRGHPEKVKDWGLRAHRSVALAAKALAAAYYDRPVQHAYFEGCSNGGRQAMVLAQNFPELFDGIVAGAPSMFYPDLLMWLLWSGKALTPEAPLGAPALSEAQRQAITQRVLQACDAADGLADGQITNPLACRFDVRTLGPNGDHTLSASAVQAAQRMYSGVHREWGNLASPLRFPGAMPGSEADWSPHFADHGGYGPFIAHAVLGLEAPFDWRRELDWGAGHDRLKAALKPLTAAPSPDLGRFATRGGKLIQLHGWNDAVVPPEGSIAYTLALAQMARLRGLPAADVERAVAALTPQQVAATALALGPQVQQYHRLFMLPATAHCGGGSGPNAVGGGLPEPPTALRDAEHHAVSAVVRWVEQGVAPERLVATRFNTAGQLQRARPLCPYPAQAAYTGKGNTDDAASFECRTPATLDVSDAQMVVLRDALAHRALLAPNR